jgi:hypothetical protein
MEAISSAGTSPLSGASEVAAMPFAESAAVLEDTVAAGARRCAVKSL